MHHIKQLHDGGSVVGDCGLSPGVDHELVHPPGAKGGADGLHDGLAGVDVGHHLETKEESISGNGNDGEGFD